ncbi:MAG: competence/damage-inducible protein A [Candidatus Eremiobacteraeota bacterium]|nr:competence/damage-inducible protein A [Candidatus Eremiobacteraeota bacterium]
MSNPSVEILAVGTELLLGQLVDTNTAHIAQQLAANGANVFATHTVGDNRQRICAALKAILERADGVITSGGLGPTVDDLTKEAVCDALGLDAVLNEAALESMEKLYVAVVGRDMPENNRKQALLPRGSLMLANPNGSAPGFVAFGDGGKFIACMPGVPREMKPMLQDELLPWFRSRFSVDGFITTRVMHTVGVSESEIDHRIGELFTSQENPKIAVLAHAGLCDVKMMAKAPDAQHAAALIEPLEAKLRALLGDCIFGIDSDSLESVVLDQLVARGETLALAESWTGGMLASHITKIAGASRAFMGGIVAYDNSIKIHQLGVEEDILNSFGAVSSEVAAAMAQGARARFGSSVALSVTGIAGPDGGTSEKPVGLVWLGIADDDGVRTHKRQFRAGDRTVIQIRSTIAALGLLWKRAVASEPKGPPPT